MELNHISSKRNDSDRTNLDLSPLTIAMINLGYDIGGWEDDCSLRNTILEEEDIVWDGTDALDPDDEFSEKTPKKPIGDTLQNYFKQLTDFKFLQNIKDNPKFFGGVVVFLVLFVVCFSNTSSKQNDGGQKNSSAIATVDKLDYGKVTELGREQKNSPEQIRSENRKRIAHLLMEEGYRGKINSVYLGKYFYDSNLGNTGLKVSDLEKQLGLKSPGKDGLEVMIVDVAGNSSGQVGLKLIGTDNYIYQENFAEWWVSVDDPGLVVYDPYVKRRFSDYKAKRELEMARQKEEKRKEELAKVNSARDAFINFHRAITNRQLRTAFDILSPDYQRFMRSYDNFARGYDTTLRSDVVELNTIHEDNDSASFAYKLKAVDREGSGQKVQYFVGNAKLVRINGQWRIDSTEAKRVSQNSTVPNRANSTVSGTYLNKRVGTITGNDVNVRTGPGVDYKSLGVFFKGDRVRLVASNRNTLNETWYKIEFDNPTVGLIVGWVRSDYIKIN